MCGVGGACYYPYVVPVISSIRRGSWAKRMRCSLEALEGKLPLPPTTPLSPPPRLLSSFSSISRIPMPSCPCALEPQAHARPVSSIARAWYAPHAIPVARRGSAMVRGKWCSIPFAVPSKHTHTVPVSSPSPTLPPPSPPVPGTLPLPLPLLLPLPLPLPLLLPLLLPPPPPSRPPGCSPPHEKTPPSALSAIV